VWRSPYDPTIAFRAAGSRCPALEKWGADARRVLRPALVFAYAEEDRLLAVTGKSPRRQRVDVAA
jgi:hypothetical protein